MTDNAYKLHCQQVLFSRISTNRTYRWINLKTWWLADLSNTYKHLQWDFLNSFAFKSYVTRKLTQNYYCVFLNTFGHNKISTKACWIKRRTFLSSSCLFWTDWFFVWLETIFWQPRTIQTGRHQPIHYLNKQRLCENQPPYPSWLCTSHFCYCCWIPTNTNSSSCFGHPGGAANATCTNANAAQQPSRLHRSRWQLIIVVLPKEGSEDLVFWRLSLLFSSIPVFIWLLWLLQQWNSAAANFKHIVTVSKGSKSRPFTSRSFRKRTRGF